MKNLKLEYDVNQNDFVKIELIEYRYNIVLS